MRKAEKINYKLNLIYKLKFLFIISHFEMWQRFSARNAKVYKIRKLHMTVFSTFYDILQPNSTILLDLGCSFQLC